jgi:hypothetical protein
VKVIHITVKCVKAIHITVKWVRNAVNFLKGYMWGFQNHIKIRACHYNRRDQMPYIKGWKLSMYKDTWADLYFGYNI